MDFFKVNGKKIKAPTELTVHYRIRNTGQYAYGGSSSNSIEVPVAGLRAGEPVRATAMSVKVMIDYTKEAYFYNSPDGNACYGFTYEGNGNWYKHQSASDASMPSQELELSSEQPFTSEVGIVDYTTPNNLTIKISCKRNGYLTIEWSDQAGFYIEMMPLYKFYVYR